MTHFNEAWSKHCAKFSFNSLTILDYSAWTPFTSVGLIHTTSALILFESLMSSLDHILEKQEYKKEKKKFSTPPFKPSTQHHYWFKLSLFCSAALLWWIPTLPVPTPGCVVILSWYHDDCNLQMCFSISACLNDCGCLSSKERKRKKKSIWNRFSVPISVFHHVWNVITPINVPSFSKPSVTK